MARERDTNATSPDSVISIIGPGMTIIGDCETDGTVRIEGSVEGSVKAGKAVVIGKQGSVKGDIVTQDAVISGSVSGKLTAASRLELQATCRIDGEVHTRRMQLEEGAVLNGSVVMGPDAVGEGKAEKRGHTPEQRAPEVAGAASR
ncbi:MAG: polymer-forming cytoskeletal protein [Gemmatimonadetes bacterium]|nr:polymer-forming cytoskeletal protein [Gemmatimonadota bacterium]